MKLSASFIVTSLCLSALSSSLARAQETPAAAHERSRALVESWLADAREQERWYQNTLTGQVKREDGTAWTEDAIFYALRENRAGLEKALGNLNEAHDAYAGRKFTLAQFRQRVQAALEWAAVHATGIAIDRATWEVRRLQWKHIDQSRALLRQFDAEDKALPDEGYADAAVALRRQYARLERAQLQELLREYTAATEAFCARRGELCGDLWTLVTAAEAGGRTAEARALEVRLRNCWETPRKGSGTSMVDYFCDFPGSPDRLILRRNWVDDLPTLHRMNTALAAEPVENFRGGTREAPVEFQGTPLEQLAQTLSHRLVEFYELEARQGAAWRRLAELNAAARRTAGADPDVAAVAAALEAYLVEAHEDGNRSDARRRATEALNAALAAVTQAEGALTRAQGSVYLTRALRVTPAGSAGAHSAASLIADRRREIQGHERSLRDESLPESQRRALTEVTIPRLREEIGAIEAAVATASEREAAARTAAVAARDAARVHLNGLPAADPVRQTNLWEEFRGLYAGAVEALPAAERRDLPAVEARRTEAGVAAAGRGVNLLRERVAALGTSRAEVRREMQETLAALRRDEAALRQLGQRIVNVRIAALVAAEGVLESLGVRPQDEVTAAIGRLKDQLQKAQGIFAAADECTRSLDDILRHDPLEVRKKLVAQLQERMGVAGETLSVLGSGAEAIEAIRAFSNDIGNERTALRAVSTLLDFSANAGETVPVLGAVLAPMMKIYGMTAGAAGEAAIAIQDHVIEQNIRALFDRPRPEQHLYTLREVAASCSLFSEDAHQRITTMLQVRRLIALAGADSASEARDGR